MPALDGIFNSANITAAVAAVTNTYVTSTNMANGAYTLARTTPPAGTTATGRLVTVTATTVAGADTPGSIAVVGTKLDGTTATENIIPAQGSTVSGTIYFKSITSLTQSGWVATSTADTIVIGVGADGVICDGSGVLHSIVINTTAAGAIVLKDSTGTLATLKSSITENTYYYDIYFKTFLAVNPVAASDITATFYRIGV